MQFKIGTVISNDDITRSGILKVAFTLQDEETAQGEWVRYVTPYGNQKAAFIALPMPGSTVLCGYADAPLDSGQTMKGYFYIGSVMGFNPSENRLSGPGSKEGSDTTTGGSPEYVDSEQTEAGIYGPPSSEDEFAEIKPKDVSPFPEVFKELYEAKGITPEILGITDKRSDAVLIHNRSRANSSELPFQDHMTEIRSGGGKTVRCVDSPIVDGIIMSNEHKGKDYFIFSTGNSEMSPFAEGEFHTRTHGPINTYTLESNIHMWVEDGRNIEIENRAGGQFSPTGDRNESRTTNEVGPGSPSSRIDDIGNEDFGCVKVWSHHNNIAISALDSNSVIHIDAPGQNTKVIVRTGGTVDIVAKKKITLTSDTEVELNAPMIQLNGADEVELNAPLLDLNADNTIEEHAGSNIVINAGTVIDVDAGAEIDMDAGTINLN